VTRTWPATWSGGWFEVWLDQPRPSGPGRADARKAAAADHGTGTAILAAGRGVVAVLAATAYVLLRPAFASSGHGSCGHVAPKLPTPTASVTSGAAKLGKWGYITSRATGHGAADRRRALPAQFLINGSSFVRNRPGVQPYTRPFRSWPNAWSQLCQPGRWSGRRSCPLIRNCAG